MKELGPARKILGMEIVRDSVDKDKSVSVPLGAHFKVSLKDCSSSNRDGERMSKVLYANVVGKNYMEVVKWILKYLKGTTDVGLMYGRDQVKHVDINGFLNVDDAKDPDKGVNLRSVVVNYDNQGAIHFSRNAMFHETTKHINVSYHFIREIVESKENEVAKIGTKYNAANVFTKVFPGPKFKYCMEILDVGIN
ncbi:hypothetical protein Tco_0714775 [Tanacetum coccineum]